jgi:MFS family permease
LPLYALYAADVISVSGNMMAFIAIPWFVLQTTGSASKTGLTAFMTALPAVIAGFFGGVIIDRIGYKRTSVIADLASGVAVAMLPLLYNTVGLAFWQLLVLVFLGNLLDAPGTTARTALTPDLAEQAGISLEQASAFNDAISRSTRLIGAPLAGVLIAVIGANNVLWIDAVTYLVSALLIAVVVPRPNVVPSSEAPKRYFAELWEGVRFLRSERLLLAITWTVMITNLLDAAMSSVLMPVYVNRVYGNPAVLGFLSGILGGCAFLTALFIGIRGFPQARSRIFAVAFIIAALRFWLMALLPSLPILFISTAIIGLAVGVLNPLISVVTFQRIPANMRARVFGVITAGVFLGTPLGGASGLLVDHLGLIPTFVLLGAIYFATTASLLFIPAMRDMDRQPAAVLQTNAAD